MSNTMIRFHNSDPAWIESPDESTVDAAFGPGRIHQIDAIQFTRRSASDDSSLRIFVGYDNSSEGYDYFIVRIIYPEKRVFERLFWDPEVEDTLDLEIPDSGGGYWEFSPGNRVPREEAIKLLKRFVSEPNYTGDDLVWRS